MTNDAEHILICLSSIVVVSAFDSPFKILCLYESQEARILCYLLEAVLFTLEIYNPSGVYFCF